MENILTRLDGVKSRRPDKKGRNNWAAKCPGHDDKDPSLLITEDDSRALFYCRSGCSQPEIMSGLASLGLTGKDLNWDKGWKPQARPVFTAHHETLILIAESDLANGRRFSAADKACYKDALFRRAMS
tara:strand:+ start:1084 stop:1467 length:384 start_codon:yes stop_codon:yes gene_type:complete